MKAYADCCQRPEIRACKNRELHKPDDRGLGLSLGLVDKPDSNFVRTQRQVTYPYVRMQTVLARPNGLE